MATIVFDGTSSQTASAAADSIVFAALPTGVTGISEVGGNVLISVGSNTLTITGATLASLDQTKFLATTVIAGDGTTATAPDANGNTINSTTTASLLFGLGGGAAGVNDVISVTGSSIASSSHLIFGGNNVGDSADGVDVITGGTTDKSAGTYVVYANGGADSVTILTGASASGTTSIYGGAGVDSVTVGSAAATIGGQIFGGAGGDSVAVTSLGAMTIFGGASAGDSADLADALNTAGAGKFTVYGNGGDDTVIHTSSAAGATVSLYGGVGADTMSIVGAFSTTGQLYGGEGGDNIAVENAAGGSTTVFGGTGVGSSTDLADTINFKGAGTFTVYGNGGDDTVTTTGLLDGAKFSVYGGVGADTITAGPVGVSTTGQIYGGEGGDTINASTSTGGSLTVFGGTGLSDSTDGVDNIKVDGLGKFTVYGNAGADVVKIGNVTDGTNTATVFGGLGNDSITVDQTAQGTLVEGGINLSGNEGNDTFIFSANAVGGISTTKVAYVVSDFVIGQDVLDLAAVTQGTGTAFTISATPVDLAAGVTAASAGDGSTNGITKVFQFGADTYVVVDNTAGAGYTAATDTVIKLTGVTAANLTVGSIVV